MEKIANVRNNTNVPDEVLAQTVGNNGSWQLDQAGVVYDQDGVFVAASLAEAATAMRELGWFTPRHAMVTGVNWREIDRTTGDHAGRPESGPPPRKHWADIVRLTVRRQRH